MKEQQIIQTDRQPPKPFEPTDKLHTAIAHETHHYEDPRAASIEALKMVQKHHGWVPDEAIEYIANILGISSADVEGVATFYSQIFRQEVGRHIIRVCDSMVCFIGGYHPVLDAIRKKLGIELGETTKDNRFTLLPVCCLGNCDKAPAIMIDEDTYGHLTPESVEQLLEAYQ